MKSVDILVAVRNEEKTIPDFINRFDELTPEGVKLNIIFLEDGSSDGTVSLLKELSLSKKNVNYISIENKYGQYAALTLGLIHSNADAVVTMDVDGGHPVKAAIEMIKSFLKGNNLVQGHRIIYKRKKFYRSVLSYVYNLFFYVIVGVNFLKQNVMFRLMDKPTKEKFLQHKNWWHIFKTNFKSEDKVKTDYIEYSAPERELGESKYGFLRLLKLSYKSFFALLSVKRLIIINLVLIGFVYLFISHGLTALIFFTAAVLLLIDFSFYIIVYNYPIAKLKILETSLSELKR